MLQRYVSAKQGHHQAYKTIRVDVCTVRSIILSYSLCGLYVREVYCLKKFWFWLVDLFLLLPLDSEHWASVKRFVSLRFLNLRHSVRLLGRMISPSQGRYLTQTQNTDINALSGIRNHDSSVRASEDSSCLRPHGHCDRQTNFGTCQNSICDS
jgi:hypothetical protein